MSAYRVIGRSMLTANYFLPITNASEFRFEHTYSRYLMAAVFAYQNFDFLQVPITEYLYVVAMGELKKKNENHS